MASAQCIDKASSMTALSTNFRAQQRCGNVAAASAIARLNIGLGGPGWLNELSYPPTRATTPHNTSLTSNTDTYTTPKDSSFHLHHTSRQLLAAINSPPPNEQEASSWK
uniref:Uncharacterized protein n=1 Tax=Bactrocera latifrons TaxID=174628 RepID=A0A0K8W6H0_BACLA